MWYGWVNIAKKTGEELKETVSSEQKKEPLILIEADQLKKCCPSMSIQRASIMADLINRLFPKYGIVTQDTLHEPLANFIQESLEFQYKVENMYYKPFTLIQVWPSRFYLNKPVKSKRNANDYARNPKKLANLVYGGRMGNIPGTDDGWNFRGSGFVGLTGRATLTAYSDFKGFATPEEGAEFARNSDYGALDSALWFFCVLKDLIDEAERDEFSSIVKEINGGYIGMKDRKLYYDRVKQFVT